MSPQGRLVQTPPRPASPRTQPQSKFPTRSTVNLVLQRLQFVNDHADDRPILQTIRQLECEQPAAIAFALQGKPKRARLTYLVLIWEIFSVHLGKESLPRLSPRDLSTPTNDDPSFQGEGSDLTCIIECMHSLIEEDVTKGVYSAADAKGVKEFVNTILAAIAAPIRNNSSPRNPYHPTTQPGRNQPCPCGSMAKFKKCHGKPV